LEAAQAAAKQAAADLATASTASEAAAAGKAAAEKVGARGTGTAIGLRFMQRVSSDGSVPCWGSCSCAGGALYPINMGDLALSSIGGNAVCCGLFARLVPCLLQEAAGLRASLRDATVALETSEAGRKKAGEDLAAATAAAGAKAADDKVRCGRMWAIAVGLYAVLGCQG
jgi:hypothetical protein